MPKPWEIALNSSISPWLSRKLSCDLLVICFSGALAPPYGLKGAAFC
jgi:hypothetical protein